MRARLPERDSISLKEPVAQPVEHVTFNHGVLGSSPSGLTTRVTHVSGTKCQPDLRPLKFACIFGAFAASLAAVGGGQLRDGWNERGIVKPFGLTEFQRRALFVQERI
jgi:hypothetical protein